MSNYDSFKLSEVTVTVTKGAWDKSDGKKRNINKEETEIKYSYKDINDKPKKTVKGKKSVKAKEKAPPEFILYDFSKKHENPIIKVVNVINNKDYKLDDSYEFEIDNSTNDNDNPYNDNDDDQPQIKLSRLVSALDNYYIVEITANKAENMY